MLSLSIEYSEDDHNDCNPDGNDISCHNKYDSDDDSKDYNSVGNVDDDDVDNGGKIAVTI